MTQPRSARSLDLDSTVAPTLGHLVASSPAGRRLLHRRRGPFQAGALRALAAVVASLSLALAPLGARGYAQQAAPRGHVVADGDTLWQIAVDAGLDAATLMDLNGLADGDLIVVGQVLKLPGASVPAAAASPAVAQHTVAEGETLWAIAQQYGTSVDAIARANDLEDADRLVAGVQLRVPGGTAAAPPAPSAASAPPPASAPTAPAGSAAAPAAPAAATSAPASAGVRPRSLQASYTVLVGDTLARIGRQFGASVEAIVGANSLADPNRIVVGAVLRVPVPARERVVQAGETLSSIAAEEKVDLGSLVDFNEIGDPQLIRVGQVVAIPALPAIQSTARAAESAAAPEATPAPAAAPPSAPAPSSPPAPAPTPRPAATTAPTPPPAPRQVATPPPGVPADGLAGAAAKLLGKPYVWGGSGPDAFDCSGLVWYAARQAKKALPRGLFEQYNSGPHPPRDDLKVGDLVFFQNTYLPGLSHNGVYAGNGLFIHAADESSGVTVSSLASPYWASRYFGATRPD